MGYQSWRETGFARQDDYSELGAVSIFRSASTNSSSTCVYVACAPALLFFLLFMPLSFFKIVELRFEVVPLLRPLP